MRFVCLGCRSEQDLAEGTDLAQVRCPRCRLPASQSFPYAKTVVFENASATTQIDGQPRPAAAIPRQVGKYEILGKAGTGGMGVVYKARHTELNRVVALKVMIAGEHAGEDTLQRFQREARAAAGLQHPNIVSVYDVGEEPPLYYIVMEYVDGTPLDDLIRERTIPPEEAARMVRDLARALHYAHQQNIVHRDIKPGNILVDRHGVAKLVDFGLAKSMTDDQTLTRTGEIIGTASYMPPEQASGSMRNVDAQSDVYSLGTVLYEMLARRAPFGGDTIISIIKQVEQSDPPPPSKWGGSIPRDLETICLKAMAKEKGRRYETADDFARDLDNFLLGVPIQARPSSMFYRVRKWSRRHPVASTALSTGIVAAAVIAALWYGMRKPPVDDPRKRFLEALPHYENARREIEEKAAKYRKEDRTERRQVLEKAVAELNEAIRIYPEYADAHYLRGVARQALAQPSPAQADFDRAIALDPRQADAYYARLLLRLRALRDRKTRAQFETQDSSDLFRQERELVEKDIAILQTLRLKPEKALVAEARFDQVFGDSKKALALADRAVEANRAFADAYVVRASIRKETALQNLRRDEPLLREALEDCDSAIHYEVNNAEAYRVRAEVRLALHRYPEAVQDLEEMVSIAPDEAQTYVDRALVLGHDPFPGRSSEQIAQDIEHALTLDPNHPTARFLRAVLVLESPSGDDPKEKYRRARDDLDAALRSGPEFPMARVLRLVCDFALEDESASNADLEIFLNSVRDATPDEREKVRNRIKGLVQFLRLRYNVRETEAIANAAYRLLLKKRHIEAETKYREVLRRVDNPIVVETEGLNENKRKQLRAVTHYNLACIYSIRKDADRGIEELTQALAAGYSDFSHILEDPDLEAVRAHPGFEELRRKREKR